MWFKKTPYKPQIYAYKIAMDIIEYSSHNTWFHLKKQLMLQSTVKLDNFLMSMSVKWTKHAMSNIGLTAS